MTLTIKAALDAEFDQVNFDRKLCQRIIRYSNQFMTRNDDHSAFFGGVLLGVHPIRFLESDRETWYDDVLEIDETLLINHFSKVTTVDHEFKVSGDVFNYTPIYVAYRLENSNLPRNLKREAQIACFMVMHFRFLTSLLVRRFKYPADRAIAQATYMALSGRFDIRRYGSWRALLEARAEGIIAPNSIYRKVIQRFEPDPMIIRTVTDTQTRLRALINKIYAIHCANRDAGVRMTSTSATAIGTDGEMILKDSKSGYSTYLRYINEVVQTRNTFVKEELLDIVNNAMPTMPPQLLRESLTFMSDNYGQRGMNYVEDILRECMLYTFDYFQSNRRTLGSADLAGLIVKLRALFTASRTSDPVILRLRKDTEKLVKASSKTRNNAVISAVRTGVLLYVVIRTMTRNHYS